MGGIFISQQATGLAWLRKVSLMVIVHQLLMESEKRLALNGDKEAIEDMKSWPVGRTYVYGVGFQDGPRTVQQPYFTRVVDDSLGSLPTTPTATYTAFPDEADGYCFNAPDGKIIQFSAVNTDSLVNRTDWLDEQVPNLPDLPEALPENEESGQSGKGKEYLFSEVEKPILINLYGKFHNIEECLKTMKKGARYHKDASQILKKVGLL
jgi:hypothetical protein